MILEVVKLDVMNSKMKEFENIFNTARQIIKSMNGYISHELQESISKKNSYLLLVKRHSFESPAFGFRKSPEYHELRDVLSPYYQNHVSIWEHYKISGEC